MAAVVIQADSSQQSPFLDNPWQWIRDQQLIEEIVGIVALVLLAYIADVVAKRWLIGFVTKFTSRTKVTWDDKLHEHRVFDRLAWLVPTGIVYAGIAQVPGLSDSVVTVVQNVATAFLVFTLMLCGGSILSAGNAIYERYPIAASRPIKGYIQVAKIVLYGLGGVVIVAILLDRSPVLLFSGVGAMTAVLLLVFKDTILSLVASVQLTNTDMVRVGDWIEVPKYGADGDVIDIALHTVKVQNWDKTVTTIPTYGLIQDSFKNWRYMSSSGGRRIKRSLFIDKGTIRFLTDDEVSRFSRFNLLKGYIEEKQATVAKANASTDGELVNARRLTNVGTFRAYIVNYLRQHPKLHPDMTLLVRQLAPTENGLPIELYFFSNDTDWGSYEGIQADIFDHLMAIVSEFGLRLFQNPSGADVRDALAAHGS